MVLHVWCGVALLSIDLQMEGLDKQVLILHELLTLWISLMYVILA